YRAALDMLSARGLRRRYGESREAFARRMGAMAPSFGKLTGYHLSAALGGHADPQVAPAVPPAQPDMSDTDWSLLNRQVRQEIARHTPWWRQLLAIIDPFSWLRTH